MPIGGLLSYALRLEEGLGFGEMRSGGRRVDEDPVHARTAFSGGNGAFLRRSLLVLVLAWM